MLLRYVEAGYSCLYCTTFEFNRAVEELKNEILEANKYDKEELKVEDSELISLYKWDVVNGLTMWNNGWLSSNTEIKLGNSNVPAESPLYPLLFLTSIDANTVIFLPNYHFYLNPARTDARLLQIVIDGMENWKAHCKAIVVFAPHYQMPIELDRAFQLIDFPLPEEEEIKKIAKSVIPDDFIDKDYDPTTDKDAWKYTVECTEAAINAAKGMTTIEIENAFSLALKETAEEGEAKFDPIIISEIKQQQIKKSATLEISSAKHDFSDVVGMERIKKYLEKVAMNPLAQGVLQIGISGCGKTYVGEALANELGIPAIVVSFERIMAAGGGIVGQAQNQALTTFKTIDALAPCVCIIDEIEKGLAGVQSSARSDAGSKAGVGSIFLKWIEKKAKGIYIIATCNDLQSLPAEYKRSGRWDAIFGVDLPDIDAIYGNLEYYADKFGIEETIENISNDLLNSLDGYSHAELMTIMKHCKMLDCTIEEAKEYVKPIKDVDAATVASIQEYIKTNCIPASAPRQIKALRKKAEDVERGERKIKVRKKV